MFVRWLYYHYLTLCDIRRLWPSVQGQVIIVAGICLPILILLGLKRGHVYELRKELLTSPTGRLVQIWTGQNGPILDQNVIKEIRQVDEVDVLIPESLRLVKLSAKTEDDPLTNGLDVTLYSTIPGDPVLKQFKGDILQADEDGLILTEPVAKKLNVKKGDQLQVTVQRTAAGKFEHASTLLDVKAVIIGDKDANMVGHVNLETLARFETYVTGHRVAKFRWPAANASARDYYSGYLAFCETGTEFDKNDIATFRERSLTVEPIKKGPLADLFGILAKDKLSRQHGYHLFPTDKKSNPNKRLSYSYTDIQELTLVDDIVLPWTPPREAKLDGVPHLLVGVSVPEWTWFKYSMENQSEFFDHRSEEFSVKVSPTGALAGKKEVTMTLPDGEKVKLKVVFLEDPKQKKQGQDKSQPDKSKQTPEKKINLKYKGKEIAIVPAVLLSHLDAHDRKAVEFDPVNHLFVPVPDEITYSKARLYAKTIDDVPFLVDFVTKKRFAYDSQKSRIMEIKQQDASLQVLVYVVAALVLIFGVFTVMNVLWDSTNRERSMLGILRVMGVSRLGVFYFVFLRSFFVGILAGVMMLIFGGVGLWLLNWPPNVEWLSWKPVVVARVETVDCLIVFLGAIACCLVGAFLPAWNASRLDPFEAIVEGRFR